MHSTRPSHTHQGHPYNTLLTFIKRHNYFLLNNQHYLPTQGMAMMGTRLAPSCPNIFMAALKRKSPTNIPQQPPAPHMVTIHWQNIHAVDPRFHSPHQRPSTRQLIPPHNQIHWLTHTPSVTWPSVLKKTKHYHQERIPNSRTDYKHEYPQFTQPKQDQPEQIPSTMSTHESKQPNEATNATPFTTGTRIPHGCHQKCNLPNPSGSGTLTSGNFPHPSPFRRLTSATQAPRGSGTPTWELHRAQGASAAPSFRRLASATQTSRGSGTPCLWELHRAQEATPSLRCLASSTQARLLERKAPRRRHGFMAHPLVTSSSPGTAPTPFPRTTNRNPTGYPSDDTLTLAHPPHSLKFCRA